jgi:hypothetical protein
LYSIAFISSSPSGLYERGHLNALTESDHDALVEDMIVHVVALVVGFSESPNPVNRKHRVIFLESNGAIKQSLFVGVANLHSGHNEEPDSDDTAHILDVVVILGINKIDENVIKNI